MCKLMIKVCIDVFCTISYAISKYKGEMTNESWNLFNRFGYILGSV